MPDGYFSAPSTTFGNFILFRGFIVDGDTRPAVESVKQHFRVYPLTRAANPPAMAFVDISGAVFNCMPPTDASFFEEVANVVQEEPLAAVDPETRGLLASIGIPKDQPFAPDVRMRRILAEAAAVGNATARALAFGTRDRRAFYYPDSGWQTILIGGHEFSPGGVLDLDARGMSEISINPDSSVDIYFGPTPPAGKEHNWVQTIPGKGWYVGLRLYGPLEPWFDQTWRPGEIGLLPSSGSAEDVPAAAAAG